jgi:hypothetical protein
MRDVVDSVPVLLWSGVQFFDELRAAPILLDGPDLPPGVSRNPPAVPGPSLLYASRHCLRRAAICGTSLRLPPGDFDDERIRRVLIRLDVRAVHPIEQPNGDPAQTLVSVDKGMTRDNRVKQRGGLRVEVRIRLVAERRRPRPLDGRLQEADVADLRPPANGGLGRGEKIVQLQVLRHMPPRRRSSSASSEAIRARCSSRRWVRLDT